MPEQLIYPDVPQAFFNVLAKYDWPKVTPERVQKLANQLRNFLLGKGIAVKRRDWHWRGEVPTLYVTPDCPQAAIEVLNVFDWQTLPADTTEKMAQDADFYLKLLGIPQK